MRKEALYSYSKNFDIFNEPIQLLHVRSGKSIFLLEIHFGAAKMIETYSWYLFGSPVQFAVINSRRFSHDKIPFVVNYFET